MTIIGLLSIALRVAVVLALTGVAATLARRASAADRHGIYMIGLIASIALPFCTIALPTWSILPSIAKLTADTPLFSGVTPDLRSAPHERAKSSDVLLAIWAIGMLALLSRAALARHARCYWLANSRPVTSAAWLETLSATTVHRSVWPAVRFLECDGIVSSCTWGLIRPTIALPATGAIWSASERACAVVHELAHVRRFDVASNFIGQFACAMHWYNPLVWMTARGASVALEEACDNEALRLQTVPSGYAAFLLRIVRQSDARPPTLAGVLRLARTTGIERRVKAILDVHRNRTRVRARAALLTVVMSGAAFVSAATISPAQPRPNAQMRPDSATIAEIVRRMCAARPMPADAADRLARFTFSGMLHGRSDSTGAGPMKFTFEIRGCGARMK